MKKVILFLTVCMGLMWLSFTPIDLNNLDNYEGQFIPNYINDDLTPGNNPITNEGATLGRVLFYDKNLSANNTIACASCHKQEHGFSDPAIQSVGLDGGLTGRHSMRLINARFGEEDDMFWDERADDLEDQTTQPIQDHIEMGFSGTNGQPNFATLINKLENLDYYENLFSAAFGDATISENRISLALAQFIRSIVSFDSKYDTGRAMVNNNNTPFPNFTSQENLGKQLFSTPPNNNGAGCNACHGAPEFGIDNNIDNNGVIGVAGVPGAIDLSNTRAPSLRDLVNPSGQPNGPFMHDGSLNTLADVIEHYNSIPNNPLNTNLDDRLTQGGGGGPGGGGGQGNPQQLNLTQAEKNALEAFLLTLTGVDVYTNEKWSDPFLANCPTCPPTGVRANLNVQLEGPYNSNTGTMSTDLVSQNLLPSANPFNVAPYNYDGPEEFGEDGIPSNIVDWVYVEARDQNNLNLTVDSRAALLRNDGTIVDLDGVSPITFFKLSSGTPYRFAVHHKSHLAVLSSSAIGLPNSASLDLSVPSNVTGSEQLKPVGNTFVMHAGDFDQNGLMNVLDFTMWFADNTAVGQYLNYDADANGIVNILDFQLWFHNRSVVGIPEVQ